MPQNLSYRKATFGQPSTLDEKKRSVEVVGATEEPAEVFDYQRYEVVNEVLLMDGAELPRSRQIPLLDNHRREQGTSAVVGSFREMRSQDGQLRGLAIFSGADEVESIWRKVREGHLTDFSVGYKVVESTWVEDGESAVIKGRTFAGPLRVTTRWRVKELSVVPIGADELAKARAEIDSQTGAPREPAANQPTNEGTRAMPETITTKHEVETAVRAERARIAEIEGASRSFDYPEDLRDKLIADGTETAVALRSIMDYHVTRKTGAGLGYLPPASFTHGADETEKKREAIIDGLCLRAGVRVEKPAPGAEEYQATPLAEICRESLAAAGVRIGGMSRHQIVADAMGMTSRAGVTMDFPSLLVNSLGKILRLAYEQAASTYQRWCKITDGVDFKEMSRVQLSEAPDLDLVPEHGEYTYGKFSDSKEVFAIQKHGKLFAVTREAIINDDLAGFTRVPLAFAQSAARKVNATAYGVLTANADMADGVALFHADHGNLASGANPTIDSLSLARLAMRKQTGLNGAILNVAPRFALLPAELETEFDQLLNSVADLTDLKNSGVVNPFYRKIEPVVEALLGQNDINAWYLAADPAMMDTVEVCFLGGRRGPYLETRDGWKVDGTEFKVRIEFGAKALDWRGLLKNPGPS